jgi:threonine aldolase
VETYAKDANHDHIVMPGMVYISQPTEYGTLYTLDELTELSNICHANALSLYVDGARLAYALASPANDVSLEDLARLCDAFYIGGTKCGALFGEALVIPRPNYIPHFFTIMKQHGALLAKGWLLGLQFDVLFTDGLYENIGRTALGYAAEIQTAIENAELPLYFESPTNQLFVVLNNRQREYLESKVDISFWEQLDENKVVMRIATSWSTTREEVDKLLEILAGMK